MVESPGVHVTSAELELAVCELELSASTLELDSCTLLELGALNSDELLAASELDESGTSDELLNSGSPQPSGGQYTPYRGCAASS